MNAAFIRPPSPVSTTPTASAESPSGPRRYGVPLTQVARVTTGVIQLASIATPSAISFFYIPDQFNALDGGGLALIKAMGFANLLSFAQVARSRPDVPTEARAAATVNAVSMLATAAVYAAIPVKPIYVAAPFIASLLLCGGVSLYDLKGASNDARGQSEAVDENNAAVAVQPVLLGLVAVAGAAGAIAARQGGSFIPAVYLAQVALSAGCWAWGDRRLEPRKRRSVKADVIESSLMAGVAICTGVHSALVGVGLGVAVVNGILRRFTGLRNSVKES